MRVARVLRLVVHIWSGWVLHALPTACGSTHTSVRERCSGRGRGRLDDEDDGGGDGDQIIPFSIILQNKRFI